MQIPGHRMFESQAMMTFKGLVGKPDRVVSFRAGYADFKGTSSSQNQTSRSATHDLDLPQRIEKLEVDILKGLKRFGEIDGELNLSALIRNRRVTNTPQYHQSFSGFWGSFKPKGSWPAIFGSVATGDLVFRRGPWEDWSPELPRFEKVKPRVPIILSPYCTTLLHEAVGHAMEAEYLPDSPLRFHQGNQVTHSNLSMMDRPDLVGFPGSMSHDDTGQLATETTLIHKGFLVGDLDHDKGVWRRGSYRDIPQIRASNFLVKPGPSNPKHWLENHDKCYYISWIQSGNWQPGSHKIKVLTGPMFYLKKGCPIAYREWTILSFSTLELLSGIIDVGDDLLMDPVVHWCVKKNQATPMGMGGPSLLLKGLLN